MNASDRLARFIDDLLHEHRPGRYPADPEEGRLMLVAALLKVARPGTDLPRQGFVEVLEQRLGDEVAQPPVLRDRVTRRRMLALGGTVVAASVAGVILDRSVSHQTTFASRRSDPRTLTPRAGQWVSIVALAALRPGDAVRFSAGAIEGYVTNHDGKIEAVSAICSHMGCTLRFNQPAARLDCPCHSASFALDGSPINRAYLDSLTRLDHRVNDGSVEVKVASA